MSAWLCSSDTFDLLGTAAMRLGRPHMPLQVQCSPSMPDVPMLVSDGILLSPYDSLNGFGQPEVVAKVLRAQNVRSVAHRYNNPDDMGLDEPYTFRPVSQDVDPVVIIKSCRCLRYQSCETDDYPQTLAYRVLDEIEDLAICALPGYEAAPWGWKRTEPAAADEPTMGILIHCTFRPQAWLLNGYPIDIDPPTDEPTTWTMRVPQLPREHSYESDDLRMAAEAPAWVRDWRGPFEVDFFAVSQQ